MDTPMGERRLHRSRTDRAVFGVCGGLGEYFEIDPVIVRLAFVLISLAGGAGVLVYIILAIVLPEEGLPSMPGQAGLRRNLDTLATNTSELASDMRAGLGGARTPLEGTEDVNTPPRRVRNHEMGGLILVGLGVLFIASNLGLLGWFRWDSFWPVILIIIGGAILLRRDRRS